MVIISKQILSSYVFSSLPISFLLSLSRTRNIFPYYHLISDDKVIHTHHLFRHKNTDEFKKDLQFITKHFTPVGLLELIAFVNQGRGLPMNAMHLTFDDGYRENYDVIAPILLEMGIPATFFVSTDFIDNKKLCFLNKISILIEHLEDLDIFSEYGNELSSFFKLRNIDIETTRKLIREIEYFDKEKLNEIASITRLNFEEYLEEMQPFLTEKQLRILISRGFTIGSHSLNHPRYSSLSLEEQLIQTKMSINHLVNNYQLKYRAFAFPHSDEGVRLDFFNKVFGSELIEISFGTGGIRDDCSSRVIQRISMEKPALGANRLVPLQLARRTYRDLVGINRALRDQRNDFQ